MKNFSLFLALAGVLSATAETVTLTPVADTALFKNSPGNNLGRVAFMPIGMTDQKQACRGLVRFDLSEIPANATLSSVTLRITATRGQGSPTLDLHRMLVPWSEGLGVGGGAGGGFIGSAARAGEPTWNQRAHPSSPWTVPGGGAGSDFAAAPSASVVVNANTAFTFQSSAALLSDVEAWIQDASDNHGWLLKVRNEATGDGDAHRFTSREIASGAPVLTVVYELPAAPASPALQNPSVIGTDFVFHFDVEASVPYAVQHAPVLPADQWLTLTNVPAAEARTVTVTDPLTPSNRLYRVEAILAP